jgi:predicted choloylglycine hydrolase
MKEIRIKGTYEELGKEFGKTLSQWHRTFKPKERNIEFAHKCVTAVEEFASDLLVEIRALADATGTSYDALYCTNLTPAFAFGCTLVAISGKYTANGSPIIARQHDWMKEDIDALHAIHTEPKGHQKSIGFSYGDIGRYGGLNKSGLAIGSAGLASYTGKLKSGVRMNISTRWILDNFSTTKEAVDYLLEIPHTEASKFLIVDKKGTIAVAECTPEGKAASYIDDGLGIATNVFKLEETKHLDSGLPDDDPANQYHRILPKWFAEKKGSITFEDMKALCKNTENGICQADEKYMVTIWSWIAETNPTSIEIAPGQPFNTEYKVLEF